MLEKLQSFADKAKAFIIWVATPVAFVLGFIYYLWTKDASLEKKLAENEAEKALDKTLAEEKVVDEKANDSVSDYERTKQEYLSDAKLPKRD